MISRKAVGEGGRRARICVSICLGAAAVGIVAVPFAGPLWPVVLALSGAVVVIFGVSAWGFRGREVEEVAIEHQAERESRWIACWTYTEPEWKAYMITLWEIEQGGGFRMGAWIATPLAGGFGALIGLMYRDNPAVFAACVLGGAALGFGFVRGLRALSLLFTGPDVVVPTFRVSREEISFEGEHWSLSQRGCYLSAAESTDGVISLRFNNAETLEEDYQHILIPIAERGRTEALMAFLQEKIQENQTQFEVEEEQE